MLFPPVSDVLWMLMRASEKPDSGGSDSLLYFVRILFFFLQKTRVAASDDLTNTVAGSLTNTDAGTAP